MKKLITYLSKILGHINDSWFLKVVVQTLFIFVSWVIEKRTKNNKLRVGYKKFLDVSRNIIDTEDTVFGALSKADGAYRALSMNSMSGFYPWAKAFVTAHPEFSLNSDKFFTKNIINVYIDKIGDCDSVEIFDRVETTTSNILLIKQYKFSNNRILMIGETVNWNIEIDKYFIANFDYKEFYKEIIAFYDKKVFIDSVEDPSADRWSQKETLVFEPLRHEIYNNTSNDFWYESSEYDSLKDDIKKFKDTQEQRTYMVIGPPGTGKTANILKIIEENFKEVVKVDGKIFDEAFVDLEKILVSVGTKAILIDDADRLFDNAFRTDKLLYLLESIKTTETKPFMFFTGNNIDYLDEALLRPGRIDKISVIKAPTEDIRRKFIKEFFKDKSIEESTIEKLTKETNGLTQSYIKESCKQLYVGISIDTVLADLKTRKDLERKRAKPE